MTQSTETLTAPPALEAPPVAAAPPAAPPRRLTRVREGKKLAGVATGVARYLDVDPVVVRVGFALATIFSGAGVLLYVACWVLMPAE